MAVINKSRDRLANELENLVLKNKIAPSEMIQILVCYLIRQGTITEISLPTATE